MAFSNRESSNEPPANPAVLPHGLTQTNPANVDDSAFNLVDKVQSRINAATNTFKRSTWSRKSAALVQELPEAIKSTPEPRITARSAAPSSSDLPRDLQQGTRVTEDIGGWSESASSQSKAKNKGFLGFPKPTFSWGKPRAQSKTCPEDSEKLSEPLSSRSGNSLRAKYDVGPSSEISQHAHPSTSEATPGVELQDNPTGVEETPAKQTGTTQKSTAKPPQIKMPTSVPSGRERDRSESAGALNTAGKIFAALDIASGFIPVVGSYLGAAAKVGAAVVQVAEKMDENEQVAKDVEKSVLKLSDLIEYSKVQSALIGGENLKARINEIESEIIGIQRQAKKWKSYTTQKKAWSATEYSNALNAYAEAVKRSAAEMQLLASFNITDLLQRIYADNLLDRLGKGYYGAQRTSSDNAACLPGTRVKILENIDKWINDWEKPRSAKRVLWIRGMPGRGKSTIARTVAKGLKDRAACAIFHVRRDQDGKNKQVICAIAWQLAQSPLPEVAAAILKSVQNNRGIASKPFEDQFEKLLIEPLQSPGYSTRPIVLIIDAIDEFQDSKDAVELIDLIHDRTSELPANIKFLITSRPEATLLNAFHRYRQATELDSTLIAGTDVNAKINLCIKDLDSIPDTEVTADITLFVQERFTAITTDNQLGKFWYSTEDIVKMVKMSQGLFQWASTAMAYIGERSPIGRLREVLRWQSKGDQLNSIYEGVLSNAFNSQNVHLERRELLCWVLETLVVTPRPVTLEVVAYLYADHVTLGGQKQDEIVRSLRDDILGDLNSLIRIPENPSEPILLLHTSIRDFLTHKEGSAQLQYAVDIIQAHRRLLDVCLGLMKRGLKRNICDLSDLSKPTSDTDEIRNAVDLKVPQGLRHCCRVWSIHLTAGRPWNAADAKSTINLPSEIKPFSENNILKWLEIMSLIGAMDEAWAIAKNVWQWLLECPVKILDPSLIALWDDTQRFIAVFYEPISYGVLHVYSSAVAQCPVKTNMWRHYGSLATVQVSKGLQMQEWSPCVWSKSMDSRVCSIAISPDGKTLASGFGDGIIRLWNAQTGSSVGKPLRGHSDWVNSVAFSPDSITLASGSHDCTIQLWNVQSGAPLSKPLQGHSGSVRSVAFSPDGKTLASGSSDFTICLWDWQSGSRLGKPLQGHSGSIRSAAFSSDGETLASGSYDNTIRLWNWKTWSPLGEPLRGHSGSVTSISFLPDGVTLVSGSEDKTIRLWNSQTGVLLGNPLEGHSEAVLSVTCSLDGNTLASGSHDCAIRLWNAQDGSPVGEPLKGHSGPVTSVAFSPDSKTLASGSHDFAIRLWNAQTGPSLAEPQQGHSDSVTSFAFSPDGKTLASGSNDRTIRLWNADTGSLLGKPLQGHSDSVTSVAFSLDGETLASGSDDRTVRLWKVQTRSQLGKPLQGHSGSVKSVAFSVDGRMLASGSDDETIRLWNVQTGSLFTEPLEGHSGWVRSVAFSPDGKTLASGSHDDTIRLWNAQTGSPSGKPLEGHRAAVLSVAFSPDSQTVSSGSEDRTIRLWEVETGLPLGEPLKGHSDWVRSVAFSPDGRLRTSIHQQTHMHGTSQPGIELSHQGQWLTLGNDRLLWLPENYWRGFDGIALLFKGIVAFVSGGVVFCFNVSAALKLLVD